jgi:hypothetical protein
MERMSPFESVSADRSSRLGGSPANMFVGVWLHQPPAQSGPRFNILTFDTFDAKSGFFAILFIFI